MTIMTYMRYNLYPLNAPAHDRHVSSYSHSRALKLLQHRPDLDLPLLKHDPVPHCLPGLRRVIVYVYTSRIWRGPYTGCCTSDVVAEDHRTRLRGEETGECTCGFELVGLVKEVEECRGVNRGNMPVQRIQ